MRNILILFLLLFSGVSLADNYLKSIDELPEDACIVSIKRASYYNRLPESPVCSVKTKYSSNLFKQDTYIMKHFSFDEFSPLDDSGSMQAWEIPWQIVKVIGYQAVKPFQYGAAYNQCDTYIENIMHTIDVCKGY